MSYDCSCNGGIIYGVAQCKSCNCAAGSTNCACSSTGTCSEITQKRIWHTVGVPSSEYTMNLGALNVYNSNWAYVRNWNQMSDRPSPGVVKRNVPSRGNSTRSSITRMRPGSTSAPGSGVDIKHGSYARYLARIKGQGPLRTQRATGLTPLKGNKTKSIGIVSTAPGPIGANGVAGSCLCFTLT